MKYRYKGKDYYLELNASGEIKCGELDITGDTAAEVQKKIQEHVNAERSKTGKIKILTFGNRGYETTEETEYYEGTTTNIGDRWGAWVSWKEKGRNDRAKMGRNTIYLDTPENRATLDAICDLRKQRERLEQEEDGLLETLAHVPDPKDN